LPEQQRKDDNDEWRQKILDKFLEQLQAGPRRVFPRGITLRVRIDLLFHRHAGADLESLLCRQFR
jgi:hypothetical protein